MDRDVEEREQPAKTGEALVAVMSTDSLGRFEQAEHGVDIVSKRALLDPKLAAPLGSQLIELCAAIVFRERPFAHDESALVESVEREIERAIFDLDRIAACLIDPASDSVSMARTPGQCAQDQKVERARQ